MQEIAAKTITKGDGRPSAEPRTIAWGSTKEVTTREHLPHLLMLAAPLPVLVGLFAWEWRRTSDHPTPPLVLVVAALAAGSGTVHLTVTQMHFDEAAVLGWFFLLLGIGQLSAALMLLLVLSRSLLVGTVLSHLGIVVLWAWTRTVGVPFGVAGGHREGIGAADLTATAFEVGVVLVGLLAVGSEPERSPDDLLHDLSRPSVDGLHP